MRRLHAVRDYSLQAEDIARLKSLSGREGLLLVGEAAACFRLHACLPKIPLGILAVDNIHDLFFAGPMSRHSTLLPLPFYICMCLLSLFG